MAKRMNFYIKREDVREYIREKGNQSHYIESLVLKDIEKNKNTLTEDEVIELIKKYSSNNGSGGNIDIIDLDVKESLNRLFDF